MQETRHNQSIKSIINVFPNISHKITPQVKIFIEGNLFKMDQIMKKNQVDEEE